MFGLAGGCVLQPMLQGCEADLHPIMKEFVDSVAAEPPLILERFMTALLERDRVRIQFLKQMQDFPALLCPVCSILAFRHRERSWQVNGRTVQYVEAMSYAQWANILGLPAAVVPVAKSSEGLPIGVQVVGRPRGRGSRAGGWRRNRARVRRLAGTSDGTLTETARCYVDLAGVGEACRSSCRKVIRAAP